MFQIFFNPLAGPLLLLIGGYCVLRSLGSWVSALQLLILAVLFGGIVGARMGSGAFPILFRDATIIVPLYAAFFVSPAGISAVARFPGELVIGFSVVLLWLAICAFNPAGSSGYQLLIGLKIWMFYVPLMFVGVALAQRPAQMFKVLRFFLYFGLAACAIGLIQALLIRLIGYGPAISLFFGEGAAQATQGFTYFTAGGGIYRVPGTFSFGSQFVGFLYCYLTVAMIELNADPDPGARWWAKIGLFMALTAAVVSGTKGALIIFPVMVVGYVAVGLIRANLLLMAPIAGMFGIWGLSSLGVRFGGLFAFGVEQVQHYGGGFFFEQIADAIDAGPFGNGIGSNTNAVRYLRGIGDPVSLTGFESYYAKITAELGWVGLLMFSALFLLILLRLTLSVLRNFGAIKNTVIAPLAIYVAMTMIISFKAWVLDFDPANIFFWLALGLAIGVERGAFESVPAPAASRPPPQPRPAAARPAPYAEPERR